MTTTISRLYNNYTDAQRAVAISKLQVFRTPISASSPITPTAGIPKTKRSTVTTMASMIAQKALARVLASVPAWVVQPGCWRV